MSKIDFYNSAIEALALSKNAVRTTREARYSVNEASSIFYLAFAEAESAKKEYLCANENAMSDNKDLDDTISIIQDSIKKIPQNGINFYMLNIMHKNMKKSSERCDASSHIATIAYSKVQSTNAKLIKAEDSLIKAESVYVKASFSSDLALKFCEKTVKKASDVIFTLPQQ